MLSERNQNMVEVDITQTRTGARVRLRVHVPLPGERRRWEGEARGGVATSLRPYAAGLTAASRRPLGTARTLCVAADGLRAAFSERRRSTESGCWDRTTGRVMVGPYRHGPNVRGKRAVGPRPPYSPTERRGNEPKNRPNLACVSSVVSLSPTLRPWHRRRDGGLGGDPGAGAAADGGDPAARHGGAQRGGRRRQRRGRGGRRG